MNNIIGLGHCVNSCLIAPSLIKEVGGQWVRYERYEKDRDWATVRAQARLYDGFGQYFTARSIDEAWLAWKAFGNRVRIGYLNEPDQSNQCFMSPDDYHACAKVLHGLGVPIWGPGLCTLVSRDWYLRFKQLGTVSLLAGFDGHGYSGKTVPAIPEDLVGTVGQIRSDYPGKPLMIGEMGPGGPANDKERADFLLRLVKVQKELGIPVCSYRLPNPDGTGLLDPDGTPNGFSKPTEAFLAVRTALAAPV